MKDLIPGREYHINFIASNDAYNSLGEAYRIVGKKFIAKYDISYYTQRILVGEQTDQTDHALRVFLREGFEAVEL